MIRSLVRFALHQPVALGFALLLFLAAGWNCFRALPIEAFPDVTDTQVTIVTLYPGRAAEEVEKAVTIPIEIELAGLPNSLRTFSHTQFGLSYIIVTFDDAADPYFARQQVLERLSGASLPEGVQPTLAPLSTPIGEIYRYRVSCPGKSPTDLRSIQDWVIEKHLRQVPGVAEVVTSGGFIKQFQVTLDLARMKAFDVSLQQVYQALARGNANAGGSYVERGEQQLLIRGIGLLRRWEDIADIVICERKGTPVTVRHVAHVDVGTMPRQGISGQDDDDEAVMGIVLMRKGENPSDVLANLKKKVESLNTRILPPGVKIKPFYDRTWLISTTLTTVFHNLAEGALLVALVLWLFLGALRPAGIVACLIPLALLGTFIALRLRGIPANLLSLGAMDFGIIVDGAVIVVENVCRRLAHRTPNDPLDVREAVLEATVQVGRPTFFSMLIIITAHLPILFLQRHEGRIFAPMAYTVAAALIGSLLFSLTLVPLLCSLLLASHHEERDSLVVRIAGFFYRPLLKIALAMPRTLVLFAVVALVLTVRRVPDLGSEFLPELNEGMLWVNVMLPAGISIPEAQARCAQIRKILHGFPEVRTVVSKAGRPEDGMDPKTLNMAEFLVDIYPPEEWKRTITREKLYADVEQALDVIPGTDIALAQPIRDNILESISQIDGQIVIKIFGEESEQVLKSAEQVCAAVSDVQGVARAFVDRGGRIPQLRIDVDRQRAARYGLNVADVEDVIETAMGGKPATHLWEGDKRFDVVVRLDTTVRRDADSIRRILIDTPTGTRVPLGAISTISIGSGAMNVAREGGTRVAAVGVFIRTRDMGGLVKRMQERVATKVSLPQGYYVEYGGEFENQERAMARLAVVVPVSILVIFVLLFQAFGSIPSACLILANIPFGLIGAILALEWTSTPLSVSAAIGFIALCGQSVLNGVVMVSDFDERRARGLGARQAVTEGCHERMRAVLMTALLALLGMLPMALSHGIGAEVQRPLAIVIIGGLVSATTLTLLALPALYVLLRGE